MSVRIPQDSERSNLVRIEGDPKGVQLARRELIEMVQRMVGYENNMEHCKLNGFILTDFSFQENERTKDLIVEQKFHRTIIGQKGEKIKEVRDKFPEVSLISNLVIRAVRTLIYMFNFIPHWLLGHH